MLSQRGVCRPSPYEIDELARLRNLIDETIGILKRCPAPDTFLGRKTQEPFPREVAGRMRPVGAVPAIVDRLEREPPHRSRQQRRKRLAHV